MIGGIGSLTGYNYSGYSANVRGTGNAETPVDTAGTDMAKTAGVAASVSAGAISSINGKEPNESDLKALKRSGVVECATCASRTYQDESNENVSFKAAAHIDPASAGATVMSHEQEHVANAYGKAEKGNGQVVSTSVQLKTAICPECGRSYVSGGVTNSTIKYNEDNQYGKNQKSADYAAVAGMNVDVAV